MTTIRERASREREIAALAKERWPDEPAPYAARLRVAYGPRSVDVLLTEGRISSSGDEALMRVDARGSLFTEVLMGTDEGEEFQIAGVRGLLVAKSFVAFERGELVEVRAGGAVLRARDLDFKEIERPWAFVPRPLEARERVHSLVDVTLDAKQREAVELPVGRSLLVLGEAGHGKTTVALHRVAHLHRTASGRFRAVVLVPTEGLRQLLERELLKLGADVPVMTYDVWAKKQARRAFADIPRRESSMATPAVVKVKRDPALLPELEARAKLPPGRIDDDEDAEEIPSKAHARRSDLQHLFGDRAILERVIASSKRAHARHAIDQVLEHTHVQFTKRTEQESVDFNDKRTLKTVDRLSIEEGTPLADANTVDVEDYGVLFEVDRLRAQALGEKATKPRAFDCIVIDEAQELAAIELRLIGRSLAKDGTLVVSGDADQQLDESTELESWSTSMEHLGATDHARVTLEIGYRCAPDVVRAAERALASSGEPWVVHTEPSELLLAEWLARELAELSENDPRATIAVIARAATTARRLAQLVKLATPARLVLDGRFTHGAAQFTSVDQVRGLEFDYVIVPDATALAYPDNGPSRRAMYVAITRARHQVVLAAVGDLSPIA